MRPLRSWQWRLDGLFHKQSRDLEFCQELESHLRLHTEDGILAGLSPEEARRQAILGVQLALGYEFSWSDEQR